MESFTPLAKANTSFSLDLLKTLGDNDKTANVFYSPFSISSALAMVMLGARGNTATQMSEVLCFTRAEEAQKAGGQQMQMQQQAHSRLPNFLKVLKTQGCQDEVHSSFAQLLSELNKSDAPYALSVANRLYGEQSFQFVEDFLGKTRKHYNAELETVDFIKSSEAARVNINGWVENQTQGKIKDLLPSGVLGNLTRLVLVNAIYFKGSWSKKFQESATRDAQFRLTKSNSKPVKMMNQKSKFPLTFIPEASCQILAMPYKGDELSMLIFLPTDIEDGTTGLEKLEKELTYDNFVEWTRPDMMDKVEVQVALPRFKMEEKYNMKNVLVSMGMNDAFDMGKSDFSGMSPANELVLSEVFHKAFVEVNEEGTEAAAATGAVMNLRCAMIPARFIADHPFLFFIRHNPSMSVLFAGRYCSPENCTMESFTPLAKANTSFSLALLKTLGDNDKTANVFYSSFSISSALAMVMLGARGNTATQMSEVLKTQGCQDEVHSSFAQLLSELNKSDAPYALSVANRLYGEQSFQFVEDFLGKTRKHYNAELETVDFIKSSEAARVKINGWVENQTQGKIKDLLPSGVLGNLTRLVLVNAIYFKGSWSKKFEKSATRNAQFRLTKSNSKPVKMMNQKSEFPLTFIPEVSCQILEMPYKGNELSMLIFLPTDIEDGTTGLEKLEKELTYDNFVEWTRPDRMNKVEVQVALPRFKMEEKYNMKNVLVSMGMKDAFDMGKSDFSGMSPANELVLSEVFHKAFVEVNEEGTEAAAATGAVMLLCCGVIPARFIADHPFLFFIRHNPSMSVLFAGRYCSPE
ncbi:serpin peptidase inhibitor, clade B (ovalbumin), member 1, like 3 [Menidia menidia]